MSLKPHLEVHYEAEKTISRVKGP